MIYVGLIIPIDTGWGATVFNSFEEKNPRLVWSQTGLWSMSWME